jgi:hypothetical protein
VGLALCLGVRSAVQKILGEDVPIFERQQRGLRNSTHRGVLGALEERVHYFQQYILRTCYGDGRPVPPAHPEYPELDADTPLFARAIEDPAPH